MELMQAHTQWANRPRDERFASMEALRAKVEDDKKQSVQVRLPDLRRMEVAPNGGDSLTLRTKGSASGVHLNNWSFGQLCAKVGAPASYLAKLPGQLATQNINHGLGAMTLDESGNGVGALGLLRRHPDRPHTLRALTSDRYARIWNADLIGKLESLGDDWKVPPSMTDNVEPSGLYCGDRDMFVFLVNEAVRIDDGTPEGLGRGLFLWNSEVGSKKFDIMTYMYRYVCGNHICWNVSNVVSRGVRHVGATAEERAFAHIDDVVAEWGSRSAVEDEQKIALARTAVLGNDRDEVVEQVVELIEIPKKTALAAYELADLYGEVDGSPKTLWGMVNGMTRYSQTLTDYAEDRAEVDAAAGRLFVKVMQ